MRKNSFSTVYNAQTPNQAQEVIERLRQSGLHPADLALTATVPFSDSTKMEFPIQVPAEEVEKADQILQPSG